MQTHLFRIKIGLVLSREEADWLFKFIRDESGIPWAPVFEGCWERAHVMASFMHQAGATPTKLWVLSSARLRTPEGQRVASIGLKPHVPGLPPLGWSLHVAPVVRVEVQQDTLVQMVLDPVVCRDQGPVEVEKWLGLLNDPGAKRGESSARMFQPAGYTEYETHVDFTNMVDGKLVEQALYDDDLSKSVNTLRRLREMQES